MSVYPTPLGFIFSSTMKKKLMLFCTLINLNDMQGTVGIYAHYGIKGIPHYVIVSPEGRIIHVWSGYGTGVLKKKLEKWVK